MNTIARSHKGNVQSASQTGMVVDPKRKVRVISPDDVRSDSDKVISLARKVAGKHKTLLEKLAK
jgi:hypothetical protein